MIRTLVS
jgi:hypothetical protein